MQQSLGSQGTFIVRNDLGKDRAVSDLTAELRRFLPYLTHLMRGFTVAVRARRA